MKIKKKKKKKSIMYSEYKSESKKFNNNKGNLNKKKFGEYNNICSAHKRENKFTNSNIINSSYIFLNIII